MNLKRALLVVSLGLVSLCAVSAKADTMQVTFDGKGIHGMLNLTATAMGGGEFLVTGATGYENGRDVTGIIAPNASGFYRLPDGDGYIYNDLIWPDSKPVLDIGGLLLTIMGSKYPVNLYYEGGSGYVEANYRGGGNFPKDFDVDPVTVTAVPTPEPSSLVLCIAGMAVLAGLLAKKLIS